jgi:competence protein ComEC
LDVDVLVAGHHGSRSSSSAAWLAAVSPDWVVYSVGYLNRFGFPAAEVRARVAAHGARQADTAQSGALHIGVGAAGISLRGERALRPRWWHRSSGAMSTSSTRTSHDGARKIATGFAPRSRREDEE